jgi:hypothetical protein
VSDKEKSEHFQTVYPYLAVPAIMNAQLRPPPAQKVTKSRTAITKEQKRQLRVWYFAHAKPPGHSAAAAWFQTRFKLKIRQSTISKALSAQYKYLDTEGELKGNAIWNTKPRWPELDEVLFAWQQTLDCVPSQDSIVEKAQIAWPQLYPNVPPPSFSNGWLQRFKDRHHIKIRTKPGEVGEVPEEAEVVRARVETQEARERHFRNILSSFAQDEEDEDGEGEEDEEDDDDPDAVIPPHPTVQEAILALLTVQHWYETQADSTFEGWSQINKLMTKMQVVKANNTVQKTLHTPGFLG